jgi:glutathione S-transferase
VSGEYDLHYWPTIQGRGEFVRLVLEEAGATYRDVGRLPRSRGGGVEKIVALMEGEREGALPFAPPILVHGEMVLAQTALICAYLGERHGLAPAGHDGHFTALQHMLTIADIVAEVHETHHPISASLYYEDQLEEARRAAELFRSERLPRFLEYFEGVLSRSGGKWMMGEALTYVDLAIFQLLEGLAYAFPRSTRRLSAETPRLRSVRQRVRRRPRVAAYLRSKRRIPFNEEGIFRRYAELDPAR